MILGFRFLFDLIFNNQAKVGNIRNGMVAQKRITAHAVAKQLCVMSEKQVVTVLAADRGCGKIEVGQGQANKASLKNG